MDYKQFYNQHNKEVTDPSEISSTFGYSGPFTETNLSQLVFDGANVSVQTQRVKQMMDYKLQEVPTESDGEVHRFSLISPDGASEGLYYLVVRECEPEYSSVEQINEERKKELENMFEEMDVSVQTDFQPYMVWDQLSEYELVVDVQFSETVTEEWNIITLVNHDNHEYAGCVTEEFVLEANSI